MPVVTDLGPCTCCGGCPMCPGSPDTVYLTLTGTGSCYCGLITDGVPVPLTKDAGSGVDHWTYTVPESGDFGDPGYCPTLTVVMGCLLDAGTRYYFLSITFTDRVGNAVSAYAVAVVGSGNTCSPFAWTFGSTWTGSTFGGGLSSPCIPCSSSTCPGMSWATAVVIE